MSTAAEVAPYPLSEATTVMGDLALVALLVGPVGFLQASSWLLSDILGTYVHQQGYCLHNNPSCPAVKGV